MQRETQTTQELIKKEQEKIPEVTRNKKQNQDWGIDLDFVVCHQCSQQIVLSELDTHDLECVGAVDECNFCKIAYPRCLMNDHLNVCTERLQQLRRQREQAEEIRARNSELNDFRGLLRRLQALNPSSQEQNRQIREQAFERLYALATNDKKFDQDKKGMKQEQLKKLIKIDYEKQEYDELCAICYTHFEEKEEIVKLRCRHLYHEQCINKWLSSTPCCPVCKRNIKTFF